MIVIIFTITGFYGLKLGSFIHDPTYWPNFFLFFIYRSSVLGPRLMENHASRSYTFLPDLRLNESFMVLAGALMAFNIIHRFFYFFQLPHVVLVTNFKKIKFSLTETVILMFGKQPALKKKVHSDHSCIYFPFCFLLWFKSSGCPILNITTRILSNLQLLYRFCVLGVCSLRINVGKIILAHITKTSFPVWVWIWVLSFLGALDANLPLLGR